MKEFSYTIQDAQGIHARPAGLLVKAAAGFPCKTTIECNGKSGDLKRIFAVMGLGVKAQMTVTVKCDGDQEEEAAQALEAFFKENL